MVLGDIHVDTDGVFTLIEGVILCGKPISATNEAGEVRNRPGVENADAVGAETTGGNDVAGEAAAAVGSGTRTRKERILDGLNSVGVRIVGIEELAEVALAHLD